MDSQSIGSVSASTPSAGVARVQQQQQQVANARSTESASSTQETKKQEAPKPAPKVDVKVPTRDPRSLQYQVDGTTHQVVATIVNDSNKTVVRQIPDAEILRIAQAIDRMQGFLVEERA